MNKKSKQIHDVLAYDNNIKYKNRGMNLEYDINKSNSYYLINDIAVIHKKPTPIKPVKFDTKNKVKIVEAYFNIPSTTDYNGIYKGKYIDFEAKETNNRTRFDLSLIHEHQLVHLLKVYRHGGISFIIVRFNYYKETYLVLIKFIEQLLTNNYKSIQYNYIKENCEIIKENYIPRLDYITVVDKLLIQEGLDEKK